MYIDYYLVVHSILSTWCIYFIIYSIQRIITHWNDGKVKVKSFEGRLIVKISITVSCALFNVLHVADAFPAYYSLSRLIIRTIYFIIAFCSWLFSSFLVYFDYARTLKSQWRGQRSFWIFNFFANIALLTMNIFTKLYSFSGSSLYQFDIIQISCYAISILLCIILSFYSIFRQNDFTVISDDLYKKLRRSSSLFDDPCSIENELLLHITIPGCKMRTANDVSTIHYKIRIGVNNDESYEISRTLADFYSLDKTLRESFPKTSFPNLKFPEFPIEILTKCST